MQIAFAADARYFDGLALAIGSVLRYTRRQPELHIHVLDGGIGHSDRQRLESLAGRHGSHVHLHFHPVRADAIRGVKLLEGSVLTYARLLLPELLPELDTVIYGDADVWYGADLTSLWETDLADRAAAAVRDAVISTLDGDAPWLEPGADDRRLPYFNAGVMKINLAYWRTHQVGRDAMQLAQSDPARCRCWDQTILNHLLRRQLVWMDDKLNVLAPDSCSLDRTGESFSGKNIHYICRVKPWMRYSTRRTFRHWRKEYRRLLAWPAAYRYRWRYWAEYLWADWIVAGPCIRPLSRLLIATRLYRMLPGLTLEKLRAHLHPASR